MRFFNLMLLATLAACGSGDKKAPAQPISDLSAPEPATSSLPTELAAPIDIVMPDYAPQYPGSTIVSVNRGTVGAAETHEVRLATTDNPQKIVDFYRTIFVASGLKKSSEFLSGGTGMMSAIGKGRKASIAIAREQDHNMVIVTYSGD